MENSDIKFCPKCGEKNSKASRFCKSCGASLPMEMIDEDVLSKSKEDITAKSQHEQTQSLRIGDDERNEKTTHVNEGIVNSDQDGIDIPENRDLEELKQKVSVAGEQAKKTAEQATAYVEKNEVIKKIIAAVIVIAIGVGVLYAIMHFTPAASVTYPTVDLNNYVYVSYGGTEPEGYAEIGIDWDRMESDYSELAETVDDDYGDTKVRYYLQNNISLSATSFSNLSNGDTLEYDWVISSGISKDVHLKFNSEAGSIEVTGLSSYLKTCGQITDDIQNKINLAARAYYEDQVQYSSSYGTSTISSFDYIGSEIATLRDITVNPNNEQYSKMYSVYKIIIHDYDAGTSYRDAYTGDCTVYWYIEYDNVILDGSGIPALDVNYMNGRADNEVQRKGENTSIFRHDGYESLEALRAEIESRSYYDYDSTIDESGASETVNSSETSDNSNAVIGTVKVNVSKLRIRSISSTSGEKKGYVKKGKTYDVYEKTTGEGYTWYRIGDNQWIADNGTWLTYTEK